MKSRISYFNAAVFKKNLTRFAPAWAVYTIMLLLGLTVIAGDGSEYYRCSSAAEMPMVMVVMNLGYAFLLGQLLFGDLFNPRMCNMIHAMPLRRETLFGTNLSCALVFSLVPNLAVALIAIPFLGSGWIISPYWFIAVTLQFLFFFGTAVFSVMISGSRLAMTAVYVLVNFLSLLLLWFAKTLFASLLFGIRVISTPFYRACPAYQMMNFHQLISVYRASEQAPVSTVYSGTGEETVLVAMNDDPTATFTTGAESVSVIHGAGWSYLAICACVGIVLMGIALVLYRRRKLETAGDFMAVKAAEPVFLVLFTLSIGAFFQLYAELFGNGNVYIFLAMGIVVGFFGGMMLLRKTTRVFSLKSFRNLGILGASIALILLLTWADPLGFSMKVPEADEVASVKVGTSYANTESIWNDVTLDAPEDIEAIINVHKYAIGEVKENLSIEGDSIYYTEIGLEYQLKDGSTLGRYYSIPIQSAAGQTLKGYYSSVECVTQMSAEEFRALEDSIYNIYTDIASTTVQDVAQMDIGGLLDAIIADCEAGNMAQEWDFHSEEDPYATYLQMDYLGEDGYEYGISFNVYESCQNTMTWLETNGFLDESDRPLG